MGRLIRPGLTASSIVKPTGSAKLWPLSATVCVFAGGASAEKAAASRAASAASGSSRMRQLSRSGRKRRGTRRLLYRGRARTATGQPTIATATRRETARKRSAPGGDRQLREHARVEDVELHLLIGELAARPREVGVEHGAGDGEVGEQDLRHRLRQLDAAQLGRQLAARRRDLGVVARQRRGRVL